MISEAQLDSIIKTAVSTITIDAVEPALLIRWPLLKLPIFNGLFKLFMNGVDSELIKQMSKAGNFLIIDAMTEEEKTAYNAAKAQALQLRAAGRLGDPNAMASIQKACANLIHLDGSD